MTDTIEFTTHPSQLRKFYKISGNTIKFELKTDAGLYIGLTEKPGTLKCEFWVAISEEHCWIKCKDKYCVEDSTQGILSDEEYVSFCVTFDENQMSLLKGSDNIVSYNERIIPNLKYFTFVTNGRDQADIKLEVPVPLKRPPPKAVSGGEPVWVPVEDGIPIGAVIGGYQDEILYIIRSEHQGSLTPGMYSPSRSRGLIAWGGEAIEKTDCEMLCGYNCVWVKATAAELPIGAVEAGYSEVESETLYVGRVLANDCIIPGKIHPSHKVCYFPFNGSEIASEKFEVLAVPSYDDRCYKKMFYSTFRPQGPPRNFNHYALSVHEYSSTDEEDDEM